MVNFAILDLGTPELIIILAIILVLFGGKKLPDLSKSIGQSVKELRKGFGDEVSHDKSPAKTESDQ